MLKRAIRTLWIALDELDQMWLPVVKDWRLNERHYGDLQGLNKAEMAAKFGEKQVQIWRRSYDTPPPGSTYDARYEGNDPRYAGIEVPGPMPEGHRGARGAVLGIGLRRPSPRAAPARSPRTATRCARWSSTWTALPTPPSCEQLPTGVPLVYELDEGR